MQLSAEDDIAALRRGGSILQVVESLHDLLTSEDDTVRVQGLQHLNQVITGFPGSIRTEQDAASLSTFFASNLTDRSCILAAAQGCLVLVKPPQPHLVDQETEPAAARLPGKVVVRIASTLLRDVPIGSLSHDNRRACLQLLLALIQEHGSDLLASGTNVIEGVIQAVDSERDPRCLLVAFELIRALVQLHPASDPPHHQHLEAKAEDLCDVVACYFPITFRLQPNSEHGITRDSLAGALEAAITCTPLFAPYVIPLFQEKLSSSVWQAKMDALSALGACFDAWGPRPATQHLARIWWALRDELSEPSEPAEPAPGVGSQSTAVAAAECLRRCIAAKPPEEVDLPHSMPLDLGRSEQTLLGLVLEDDSVADLPQWLMESSSAGESATTTSRVATSNIILSAVAGASLEACKVLGRRLLGCLVSHISSGDLVPVALALSSVLSILKGAAEGSPAWQIKEDRSAAAQSIGVTPASTPAASAGAAASNSPLLEWGLRLLEAVLHCNSMIDSSVPRPEDTKAGLLRLRVLAQLASFQRNAPQLLNREEAQTCISALLTAVTDKRTASELAQEAALGIAQISAGAHAELLGDAALPGLLSAAAEPAAEAGTPSAALAGLVAICRASPALRCQILGGLSKVVPAALALAGTPERGAQATAIALLDALSQDILPACSQPLHGPEAAAAASLAVDLIATAAGQTQQEGSNPAEVIEAAARAVQTAAAGCPLPDQNRIATEAALKVLAVARSTDAPAAHSSAVMASCAALIALRPGAEFDEGQVSRIVLLRSILGAALTADSSAAAEVAMAAAASLILKWPPGGDSISESVDEAVAVALDEVILPRLQLRLQEERQPAEPRLRAMSLLGWTGKALAMGRHPRASKPLDTVLAYLEAASLDLAAAEEEGSAAAEPTAGAPGREGIQGNGTHPEHSPAIQEEPDLENQWEDAFDGGEARAMARALAQVLGSGSGVARLDASVHAPGRILWQQKMFMEAVEGLDEKLREGAAFLGEPPAPLLLALALLAGACPHSIVRDALPQLLPWLLAALQALTQGPLADGGALQAALACVRSSLAEEAGRKLLEEHVNALMPALLANLGFRADAEVRIAALQCLVVTMELPYNLLHAHKPAVLKALAQAVDDPKRAVRMQAARTRRLWMPVFKAATAM